MLNRRDFLKLAAAVLGGAVATACSRLAPLPSPTASPTRSPSAVPTPSLSPTTASTPTSTATPSPTSSPTPVSSPTATPTAAPADYVSVQGDQFSLHGGRFLVKGFNYYPRLHPWRTFNIGEWDPQTTEQELTLGKELGANTIRTFVDYNFSIDVTTPMPTPIPYPPTQKYIQNLHEFLEIAGRLNLKVIVTLFDSMDWSIYQPENQWIAEDYVRAFVPSFANDPRILCWDLQNEPDRAIALVGADPVISFFKRVSTAVRKIDSNHLQTIGWIDRAHGKHMSALADYLDFWCFHFYEKVETLGDLIGFYKSVTTRPILLEEFGLATGGPGEDGQHTELDQALLYSQVYSLVDAYRLSGSVFWILTDFPIGLAGNPPSPNDSPEDHYGVFRVDYTEKPVAKSVLYAWTGR